MTEALKPVDGGYTTEVVDLPMADPVGQPEDIPLASSPDLPDCIPIEGVQIPVYNPVEYDLRAEREGLPYCLKAKSVTWVSRAAADGATGRGNNGSGEFYQIGARQLRAGMTDVETQAIKDEADRAYQLFLEAQVRLREAAEKNR